MYLSKVKAPNVASQFLANDSCGVFHAISLSTVLELLSTANRWLRCRYVGWTNKGSRRIKRKKKKRDIVYPDKLHRQNFRLKRETLKSERNEFRLANES